MTIAELSGRHIKPPIVLDGEGNRTCSDSLKPCFCKFEGRFLDEKLPFLHKKKAEHSFVLSLFIFCL